MYYLNLKKNIFILLKVNLDFGLDFNIHCFQNKIVLTVQNKPIN